MNARETHIQELFSNIGTREGKLNFIRFYEIIQHELDNIDDDDLEKMKDTLKHWNEVWEDFDSMDKLTILYRHAQLI